MTTALLIAALVTLAYTFMMNLLLALCRVISYLSQLLEVFSGVRKVTLGQEKLFLVDVFFNNNAINNIYWGMALLGIVLCFGFAIFAVTRKMFDLNGRMQSSIGQIITDTLKSIFLILALSGIVTISFTVADTLLRQVNYMFQNSEGLDKAEVVEFTDEQYATMGRALSIIANYGMNPSADSRYNINDCFNRVRPELMLLRQQGVLDYNYPHTQRDASGNLVSANSWQSVLKDVADSADIRYDLKADVYYPNVVSAINNAVEIMRTDASFKPLARFEWTQSAGSDEIVLDRIVFLTGTLDAANNAAYNEAPSFDDALRRPYYTGEKSLYDKDGVDAVAQIERDFSESKYDYLVAFVLAVAVIYNTIVLLLGFVARIFNMVFLYLLAPPVLASRPLDGGGKTRQWTNAFLVQTLGVFGAFVSMRLLLIFVPIIYDPRLVLISGHAELNYFAKAVMLFAAFEATKKAGGIFNGILTDTAGMTSAQAGDMSSSAQHAIGTARNYAMMAAYKASSAIGFAASPLTNRLNKPFQRYSQLGSGPSRKERATAIERKAQEKLAVQRRFAELGGTVSGGNSGGGGGAAPSAPVADAAYTPPNTSSSAPRDFTATRKSAPVAGRLKQLSQESARPDRFGKAEVSAPQGGSIPAAPAMRPASVGQRAQQLSDRQRQANLAAGNTEKPQVRPNENGSIPKAPPIPVPRPQTGQVPDGDAFRRSRRSRDDDQS